MNEQKNLFLAIAISIAIIVLFQFLFPTPITDPIQNSENEILAPAASIAVDPFGKVHALTSFGPPAVKNVIRPNNR